MEPAGAQFREAIRLDPNHALAHRSLGLVLREGGDLPAAAAELRLAVTQRPEDAEGHHILGTVLLKLNDVTGAIEEFRRAINLDPVSRASPRQPGAGLAKSRPERRVPEATGRAGKTESGNRQRRTCHDSGGNRRRPHEEWSAYPRPSASCRRRSLSVPISPRPITSWAWPCRSRRTVPLRPKPPSARFCS